MYIVYAHTSTITNKRYIGLTKESMKKRWQRHIVAANANQNKYHFHNAIRLYGPDAWTHEILEKEIPDLKTANRQEQYYIAHYDTFNKGYNSTVGGDGTQGLKGKRHPLYGVPKSEYVKECIRRRMLGKTHTKESMKKRVLTRRANLKRHKWIHAEHGMEILTTVELSEKYSLSVAQINQVLRGTISICKGWQCFTHPNMVVKQQKHMPTLVFEHPEHGVFIGTNNDLCQKYPELSNGNISKVVRNLRSHHRGWRVHQARDLEKLNVKAKNDALNKVIDAKLRPKEKAQPA